MISGPVVTVIALCYNHAAYVEEALNSIASQTYPNIQLIIIDDGSQDGSEDKIRKWAGKRDHQYVIIHNTNQGNCKSFNEGLNLAKGKYVIDFATDDVMYPDMIESQVKAFEALGPEYGVLFAGAVHISADGTSVGSHYKRDLSGKLDSVVPSGDVYTEVVSRYFISPPTVIFKREVLGSLGGYDETLAYEDYDIWVRAARNFHFHFLDKKIIKKRILKSSLSGKFNERKNSISLSTYRVCQKISWMNKTIEENEALAVRVRYEMKAAYFTANFDLVRKYHDMLKEMGMESSKDKIVNLLAVVGVDVYYFYRLYLVARGRS